ncbi:interactor of constitutive active ROP, partial [Tanacetum coccineum]
VAELETQVSQLEDALRTVKDQLIVSESWKKQSKLDAEESRNELLALTLKLEESQNLLARFSSNEEHMVGKVDNICSFRTAMLHGNGNGKGIRGRYGNGKRQKSKIQDTGTA